MAPTSLLSNLFYPSNKQERDKAECEGEDYVPNYLDSALVAEDSRDDFDAFCQAHALCRLSFPPRHYVRSSVRRLFFSEIYYWL